MSPENIQLRLSEEDERAVRDIYDALAHEGFPPQQQRPHITLTFARQMPADVVEHAGLILPGLVPTEVERVGTVIFGTRRKQTVAWLLETSEELGDAARTLSSLNPEGRGKRWVAHLTMGLRIKRDLVGAYVAALDELTPGTLRTLTAERAVFWQPALQRETPLAG